MLAFFLPFSHSLSVSVGNSLSVRMTEIRQYCRLVGLNYTNISFCPLKISESRTTGITSTLTCGAVLEINRACKRFKEHHLSFPTWLSQVSEKTPDAIRWQITQLSSFIKKYRGEV